MFMLQLKYGNRHKMVANAPILKNGRRRNHEWVAFVQTNHFVKAQDIFDSVMFILPACYNNRYREVQASDSVLCKSAKSYFECKEAGWGQVTVQIEIKLKAKFGV